MKLEIYVYQLFIVNILLLFFFAAFVIITAQSLRSAIAISGKYFSNNNISTKYNTRQCPAFSKSIPGIVFFYAPAGRWVRVEKYWYGKRPAGKPGG